MHSFIILLVSLFVLTLTACNTTSDRAVTIAGLTGDATNGKTLFDSNCASCHGADGAGTASARALTGSDLKDDADESLIDAVIDGPSSMPAFGDKFSDQEISDVVAHVRVLQQ